MKITHVDHFVLTVASISRTRGFYERILGMRAETFADQRTALHFGDQKINLHEAGREFDPRAKAPTPGSADFCLISAEPIGVVVRHLESLGVPIELGPVERTGARSAALGPMMSVYIRDPDGNLVEISAYPETAPPGR